MEAFYRKRENKITTKVIEELKAKFNLFKDNKLKVGELGSCNRFDDNFDEPNNKINSAEVFKDVLEIGRTIDNLLEIKKTNIDDHLIENYYKTIISSAIKSNTDIIEKSIIDFINKYGAFMTIISKITDPKITFSVVDFLFYCYVIYEIHTLYCSIIKNKPIKLVTFNNIYNYKINKISNKKEDDFDEFNSDDDEIYDIIDERLQLLDKKMISVKFLTIKDMDDDDYFNYRWKTIMIFSNPVSLALYELRLELSNNTETSFSICQNPYCNNVFIRYSARQKYCLEYECNLTRQRIRKQKSLNKIKK